MYLNQEELSGYKMYGDGAFDTDEDRDFPMASRHTLHDSLYGQFSYMQLGDKEYFLGTHLLGSIEDDGYLRRPLKSIANDLIFTQGVQTCEEELAAVLQKIQALEPAGIGARDLQECLLLQLKRRSQSNPMGQLAIQVIENFFEEFSKKHYEKDPETCGHDAR